VILAALPGMVKALLESGKLAKPGNSYMMVNPLGSQLQFLRTRLSKLRMLLPSAMMSLQ
jgi:hypothetical protein